MNEQLKIIISAEIDKLKQGTENAKKQVSSFKEQVDKASKEVDDKISGMGQSITNGLKTAGTAIAAAGASLLALAASTEEYRTAQAKLQTAFETAGGSAQTATDTYNDLYRVLGDGDVAVEAANHLAKLTTNQKELEQWTNICQGVYATFGDSLPIEGLTEAANETAKVGTLTGSLADALNWAGVNEEAFQEKLDACNTEAEREALIRETLTGLYDEAAKKYETTAADVLAQNEAQAKLQETTATLGEALAPVITAFTNFANDALALVTPYITDLAETYMPQLEEILTKVSDALATAFDWITQNKDVLAAIAIVIGTVVTAIGLYNVVAAIKAAMDAAQVTTLGALIVAQLASAAATIAAVAPYVLLVAAIAAIIAIIVYCIKHWDEIKEKVKEVAEKIKNKVIEMKDKVVEKFNELKQKVADKVEEMKQRLVDKFTSIKTSITSKIQETKDKITNTFNKVKDAITKPVEKARDAVKTVIDKIKGFFDFSWSLPKLKVPKFSITPQGWKVGDLLDGKIPKLGVTWNAQGGVFDKPTLFGYGNSLQGIGEDGAEAVVPLENNLGWLDKLATMLSERMGGGAPIVLEVDGKTFAQISVDSINQLTKQRGSLPLRLV